MASLANRPDPADQTFSSCPCQLVVLALAAVTFRTNLVNRPDLADLDPVHLTVTALSVCQLVVLALSAVAAAQETQYVPGSDRDAEIIRNDFTMDEAGGFVADMETSNSIVQGATGTSIPGADPETGSYTMSGGWRDAARSG